MTQDIELSKNFKLSEFIKSPTAQRLGIDNTPNQEQIDNLKTLCSWILQPIRDHYKKPIHINSGFRCKKLNESTPGSAKNSSHTYGRAADIEIYGISNLELAKYIDNNFQIFDELILEYYDPDELNSGWIHISFNLNNNRRLVLRKEQGKPYKKGLK